MERRHFMGLMTSAGLFALTAPSMLLAGESTRGTLVDTPAKRQAYAEMMLKKLCTDLGPRPSGSRAYAKGAKIFSRELKRSLQDVRFDRFEFEKWELAGKPIFTLGGKQVEAVPSYGGEGTTPGGITGTIGKEGTGFSIVDTNGKTTTLITVAPFSRAITHYQSRTTPPSLPSFDINKADVPMLQKALSERTPAFYSCGVKMVPRAQGINIVGRLPGKTTKEMLIVAHSDTVFNSPGANDNTASAIVMVMLAHAAAGKTFNHTLTFVAADTEEYGYLGAWNYAQKRTAAGTMKNIDMVINFDSLTYGPNLWISSKQGEVKDLIKKIHRDLGIKSTPIYDDGDGFVMDSEPFRDSGAKALHANSRGYDDRTLPVYHRPTDLADSVALDCMEISFLVFNEFIRTVDAW